DDSKEEAENGDGMIFTGNFFSGPKSHSGPRRGIPVRARKKQRPIMDRLNHLGSLGLYRPSYLLGPSLTSKVNGREERQRGEDGVTRLDKAKAPGEIRRQHGHSSGSC